MVIAAAISNSSRRMISAALRNITRRLSRSMTDQVWNARRAEEMARLASFFPPSEKSPTTISESMGLASVKCLPVLTGRPSITHSYDVLTSNDWTNLSTALSYRVWKETSSPALTMLS
ncbi:hypothetical protein DSECCO2_182350 [anaerobic digester metagenome]